MLAFGRGLVHHFLLHLLLGVGGLRGGAVLVLLFAVRLLLLLHHFHDADFDLVVAQLVGDDLLRDEVGQLHVPVGVHEAVLQAEEAVVADRGGVKEVEALNSLLSPGKFSEKRLYEPSEKRMIFCNKT